MLALDMTTLGLTQQEAPHQQATSQAIQAVHGPRTIDQELQHLTTDLQLTPTQQKQIRPLLEEHHKKIQALLDKNPTLSRQDLAPQIHAITDETHREIELLLTDRQKQLAKAMQQRMHDEEESNLPVVSTVP